METTLSRLGIVSDRGKPNPAASIAKQSSSIDPMPVHESSEQHQQLGPAGCRQSADPSNHAWSEGTIAPNPRPKQLQTTAAKQSTTFNAIDDNYWRVLSNRGNKTIKSRRKNKNKEMDPHLSQTKERFRQDQGHHRPKGIKQVPWDPKAQASHLEVLDEHHQRQTPAVGHQTGPQGVLPPLDDAQEYSEVDEVPDSRKGLSTRGNAIRLVTQPILGQPTGKIHQEVPEHARNSTCLVGGRHPHHGDDQGRNRRQSPSTHQPVEEFWESRSTWRKP